MPIVEMVLKNKKQTGEEMYRLVRRYYGDLDGFKVWRNGRLVPLSRLPLRDIYEFVRSIPYRRDTRPIEVVARPSRILRNKHLGMDCKKKAILLGSYLYGRGVDYRFMSSSRMKNRKIHHVFPQLLYRNNWLNFDATYEDYNPFEPKRVTNWEVL